MPRRPPPTWFNYMVAAVSPALIIAMLASFAFFLNEVFYGGFYTGRMNFILFMYVMGACLITRIGVKQGSVHALIYAIPLAGLTWFATLRFVVYEGAFAAVSGPLNIVILAVLWWAAHAITWDCTVIEELPDVDESGDRSDNGSGLLDSFATTSNDGTRLALWRRLLGVVDRENRRRAHGRSVVLFAVFALFIFAVGQMLRPTDDLIFRRYLFRLVCQVIAGALALLVTTNLLCIRRYLRQRGVDMPANMVSVWLISGGCVIAALLLACLVLPRPNPEYSLAQIKLGDLDDDVSTNSWGMGKGKRDDDGSASQSEQDDRSQGETSSSGSTSGSEQSGSEQSGSEQSGSEQSGSEQSGSEQSGSEQSGSEQSGSEQSGSEQSGSEQSGSEQSGSEQSGSEQGRRREEESSNARSQSSADDPGERSQGESDERQSASEQSDSSDSQSSPARSSTNPWQWFGRAFSSFMKMFVWLYYLVIICGVAYVVFRFHRQILEALRKFWRDLVGLWNSLFGGRSEPAEATLPAEPAAPQYKSFGEFSSPFAGDGSQFDLEHAVVYSFEALSAWGRERGVHRPQEVTPHEFAATLEGRFPQIGNHARSLADLYGQLVFAGGGLPADAKRRLQMLWQKLQA